MIDRTTAHEIAQTFLDEEAGRPPARTGEAQPTGWRPTVSKVVDSTEIDSAPPRLYGVPDLSGYWIAYIVPARVAIQSSQIVLVTKSSGEVAYYGSAHDEG